MKFKINKDHFAAGLSQVLGVVGARASMPILSNVLIEAEGDTVSLTTTNLDLGIRCRLKATVTSGGSITLPVKKLASIVNALSAGEAVVELSGQNRARITCAGSKFEIMGLPSDQFPGLPTFADQHSYTLPQAALKWVLAHPAVSVVIPGIRNVAQAEANCAVSDLPAMPEKLVHRLHRHHRRRGVWYGGT